jgi:uncharacterized membrane protein
MRVVLSYVVTLMVMLFLDSLWLGVFMTGFYREQLGPLMRPEPDWTAAALFYLLYALGVVAFGVRPAEPDTHWLRRFGRAGLFGLVAYGTYDLTNQATLPHWPVLVTCIDLVWGVVISGTAGAIAGTVLRGRNA